MFVYLFYHTGDVEYWNEEDSEIDEDFSPVTHVHDEDHLLQSLHLVMVYLLMNNLWSGGWWLLLACSKHYTPCLLEQLHGCLDFLVSS